MNYSVKINLAAKKYSFYGFYAITYRTFSDQKMDHRFGPNNLKIFGELGEKLKSAILILKLNKKETKYV